MFSVCPADAQINKHKYHQKFDRHTHTHTQTYRTLQLKLQMEVLSYEGSCWGSRCLFHAKPHLFQVSEGSMWKKQYYTKVLVTSGTGSPQISTEDYSSSVCKK